MKKTLMTLALAFATLAGNAQSSITMKFSDITVDTVFVENITKKSVDTLLVKNGETTYSCDAKDEVQAVEVAFVVDGEVRQLMTYAVPEENGIITASRKQLTYSGSKFFDEYDKYKSIVIDDQTRIQELLSEFKKKTLAGENRDSLVKVIRPQFFEVSKRMEDKNIAYIKANPNSNVSVVLISYLQENQEELLSLISDEVKKGPFKNIVAEIEASIAENKALEEAKKNLAEGKPAPEFTLKDINGKDLALSSLRGKYVVLDFWGSWCGWCIKGIPEMKKYYEKYSGKMEILGIDCNDTEEKWRNAVAKHAIPWKHVYCPRKSDVTARYAIEGYPTKIIIDPEGKIVKTVVGEDPAFYTFLDELFK